MSAAADGHPVPAGAPVTFRRLEDDDLPLLHRWLDDPGVVRWWGGDDVSEEGDRAALLG